MAGGGAEEKMESVLLLKAEGQHASDMWRGGLGKMDGAAGVEGKGIGREAGKREGLRRSEELEVDVEGE